MVCLDFQKRLLGLRPEHRKQWKPTPSFSLYMYFFQIELVFANGMGMGKGFGVMFKINYSGVKFPIGRVAS